MSFFTMSQKENVISTTNILQKKDKLSFRTDDPYKATQSSLNASITYGQPTRGASPPKINMNMFTKDPNNSNQSAFLRKCDRMSEAEGRPPLMGNRNNFSSTSGMFPNNKSMLGGFHALVKPRMQNTSMMHENIDMRTRGGEIKYEDAKMRLAEYLGGEFESFKQSIKGMDLTKKKEFENVIGNVLNELNEKLDPFMATVKDTAEGINNELKGLSNVIRLNNRTLTEKLNKFNKVFQDCLKTIEKNIKKNQENYESIEKDVAKLGNGPKKDAEDEEKEEHETQERKEVHGNGIVEENDTIMTQQKKTNKKKKK